MFLRFCSIAILLTGQIVHAQQIPIQSYSVDANGRAAITVNSDPSKYYVLQVKHHPDSAFKITSSLSLGKSGTTLLSEQLKAYPVDHYRVLEFGLSRPFDADADGLDDISELEQIPYSSPLNAATPVPWPHGELAINSFSNFQSMSFYENGQEFSKFIIFDFYSSKPRIHFINSNVYPLHLDFCNYLGEDCFAPTVQKGFVSYHPNVLAPNGKLGTFSFHYTNNLAQDFEVVQRTQELLAANLPFLTNNFCYYITVNNETDYQNNITKYQSSRISVLFESDVYAGINYWGLNQTEGYGLLRLMSPGDVPGSRDIVLYQSLPNSLPRVGGIITSVIQTPLSHVNLRAIQNNVPNAFIRDPLNNSVISSLIDHYVYFKAGQSNYELREATLEEVNTWYNKIRPIDKQSPPLNLSYDSILPLDQITFKMFDGFGAKTANVATMRTFGFASGTVPNGYAVPFYFYQEFMKHNNLFEKLRSMLGDPAFYSDRNVRNEKLKQFRDDVEAGSMPGWMMDQLTTLQNCYSPGVPLRCRSSTNNEDLPGFSGAGLYDSKTHHANEGHISKTIKEVYASLWNLRAFEEREFSRVNHFRASMGVLCYPSFENEKVNGVGVSADPIYDTDSTFYLNSQAGEELITNPNSAIPEEVLIKCYPQNNSAYSIIQYSSFFSTDSLLMTDAQMDQLRQYMQVIHDKFKVLYHAENNSTFAMDVEYKIDQNNQLVIKQARPWVSYEPLSAGLPISKTCGFGIFPNPTTDVINVYCENCGSGTIQIADMNGKVVRENKVQLGKNLSSAIFVGDLPQGMYILKDTKNDPCRSVKFIKK